MTKTSGVAMAAVFAAGVLGGWLIERSGIGEPAPVAAPTLPAPPTPEGRNGLSDEERTTFYHLSEGGEIFPVDLLLALEVESTASDGTLQVRPFLDNIERYGLLSDPKSAGNPDGLPVGISIGASKVEGVDMIGLNCPACHVGQVEYHGHALRVDGLGNMALINGFLTDMANETERTLKSPRRLARFWERVRAVRADRRARGVEKSVFVEDERIRNRILYTFTHNSGLLKAQLDVIVKVLPMLEKSLAISTPEGYGRLDALGIGRDELFGTIEGNAIAANGPVSFPHIWGMQYTGWLQWGANTNSVMERNIAQALGVGAGYDPKTFTSTVRVENLHRMEQFAYKLTPPEWPASFPPIDQNKAKAGKALFVQHCIGCHQTYALDGVMRTYKLYSVADAGTDPMAALNFESSVKQSDGRVRPFPYSVADLVSNVKLRAYQEAGYNSDQISVLEERQIRKGPQWDPQFRAPLMDNANYPDTAGRKVYRSKTLVGIWATGPFLHNGSVPTIHDLLLPAAERPVTFPVGTREIDAVKLGIQTDPSKYTLAPGQTATTFDTRLIGNWNTGHEWSFYPSLTDGDRYAIIEFLKTFTSESQLAGTSATISPAQAGSGWQDAPGVSTAPAPAPARAWNARVILLIAVILLVAAALAWWVAEWFMPHGEAARETEAADVATLAKNILTIQQRYAQEQNRPIARGTHAKGMAVRGKFEVFDVFETIPDRALAARLAQGIFAKPGVYDAVVRFANADSHIYPDPHRDVRACSIAVDLPPGLLGASVSRQDFSTNDAPTFPINDAHAFAVTTEVAVAPTQLRGILGLPLKDKLGFVRIFVLGARQLRAAKTAFQQTRFWSTVPYHHGPADVVKYSLTPGNGNYAMPLSAAIDCLQDELARHINDDLQMSCFDFGLQLLDTGRMTYFGRKRSPAFWIENASVEWKESQAPFHAVARLTLVAQSVFPPDAVAKMYIDVTGNSAPHCKPTGGINRGRPVGEAASRNARLGMTK